ncbi:MULTISPECIES: hypothetical protein [Burkholderia]|uniref:hypothetical protein n=1 Tax=Burkholderia TaxID=32008 RepID=UPI00084181FE|nr:MULTISPECIES: hypothetical protein [unclassified Burkholderia]AOK32299.1 hypothetical protein AQ611_22950 [Burkholderia sp. Bp7605]
MGLGMQIAYLGFAGSARIESEAGAQLVRLGRFNDRLAGCQLALEALRQPDGRVMYDARLDLMTREHELTPVRRCTHADPLVAIRHAFDAAESMLDA